MPNLANYSLDWHDGRVLAFIKMALIHREQRQLVRAHKGDGGEFRALVAVTRRPHGFASTCMAWQPPADGPHTSPDIQRYATILYGHAEVNEVSRLLEACDAEDAVLRFDSEAAALQWRIRHAAALPRRLVPDKRDDAYNWPDLIERFPPAKMPPKNAGPVYEWVSTERTEKACARARPQAKSPRRTGNSVPIDVSGMSKWLAHEILERKIDGMLCATSSSPHLRARHAKWQERHHGAFQAPLEWLEEPRQSLVHERLHTLRTDGAWKDVTEHVFDARCFLVLLASTQADFKDMEELLDGDASLFAIECLPATRAADKIRIERLCRKIGAGLRRQRLQPLSATALTKKSKLPFLKELLMNALDAKATERFSQLLRKADGKAVRSELFDFLSELPQVGEVIATIVTREARSLPQCGRALLNAAPARCRFGKGPSSRVLAFVEPSYRAALKGVALSRAAEHAAKRVVPLIGPDLREAWDLHLEADPALEEFEPYVEASLLRHPPRLDGVENALCEGGKSVVGRSGLRALVGRWRIGLLESSERAAAIRLRAPYMMGGYHGPMVRVTDESGAVTRIAPWGWPVHDGVR